MLVVTEAKKKRDKKIDSDGERIETSMKRFQITAEAEAAWRKQGMEDLKFSIGTGQWDEAVKADREVQGKPCLTVNRANAFLRQYTGEERQHRPAMIVSPVGSGADVETAKIHQGVLRHIEVMSFADLVYDDAYEMMMRIGSCPWLITTDYVSENSFDQEPRIEKIDNPFAAYISPFRRPDGTDPLWAHLVTDFSAEEYQERFSKSTLSGYMQKRPVNFSSLVANAEPEWVTKAGARVAQYWWLELTKETLCELPDGSTHIKKELAEDLWPHIEQERETVVRKVKCFIHDALEVLEEHEWLGKYIPLVEVNGIRLNVNGAIYKAGMVRDYRDAQRIYDFMVTRQVEHVDLYSKDPLLVPEENSNRDEEYRNLNRKNFSHMYYKAYNENGQQLPPPARAGRDVPIEAMSKIIQQADYDMKSVIGIYGPGLGEQGPENESGFAILTRQQQSDAGMVTWHDNLNRAIRTEGKILLDLWPRYISQAKVQRIINPDDSVKHAVVFNSSFGPEGQQDADRMLEEGMRKAYDVGVGDYDIVLSTGPMYRTARQEAFRSMTAVLQAVPQMAPMILDIWAKNADWPDADLAASRFKKLLPPQLQDDAGDDKDGQIAKLSSQLQTMGQQHQQLVAELARATDDIRTNRLQIESKERIAAMQAQAGMIEALIKANVDAGKLAMQAELDTINHRMELLHESMSVEQEAGQPPETPELPNKVEPKVQPITPAAPTPPVPGTTGGM